MEIPICKDKHFICINYPGVVKNVDKMLSTLGGEHNISKIVADPTRRLELKFRPADPYCKPTCGDRQNVTNLLLKVKRRKKRKTTSSLGLTAPLHCQSDAGGPHPSASGQGNGDDSAEYDYKAEILGTIGTEYTFHSMADFQYLPMVTQEDGSHKSILDNVYIQKLERRSWLNNENELFLPPPLFSRIDNPIEYAFRDAPKSKAVSIDAQLGEVANLIGVSRQRRPHYTKFANFEDKDIPTEPFPQAITKMEMKMKDEEKFQQLQKLFEERPIWSKNALKCNIPMTPEQFKICLPALAYYYITGPWRSLWVRLGFDPRKDPSAKKYQLLDFRVRQKSAGDRLNISSKRSTYCYNLPNQVMKSSSQVALIQQDTLDKDYSTKSSDIPHKENKDSIWKFRPGIIPAYRQMFYQFCDIEESEIKKLVHTNDGTEKVCDEKNGWCVPDVQEKCRAILSRYLKNIINNPDVRYSEKHQIKAKVKKKVYEEEEVEQDEDEEMREEEMEEVLEQDDNEMETEMLEYMEPEMETETSQ